ncbi:MAG: N-acetylneuraminate synthase family protein [bacterium]
MLVINSKPIGAGHPTYIIAEIGINHNGSLDIATKMLEQAVKSGVDAVKMQIISADNSYARTSPSYSIFKKVELSLEEWATLVNQARMLNIDMFATFVNSSDLLYAEQLDLPAIKISSTNITNFPLLEAIAQLGRPVIMSTGMGYLSEVDEAVRFLEKKGQQQMGILQCTSLYPTQPKDVNLLAIRTLAEAFPKYPVGFSDHTIGINCAVAAVAMGAKILEKHFTLDRDMEGPDHHFSVTPDELACMVSAVREVEAAFGSSMKGPVLEERSIRDQFQRSLVASEDIREGERLEQGKIITKRSEVKGIAPKYMDIVIGRIAKQSIAKDAPITWDAV